MAGLSFHVSASGMTVVAFMPSCAHAEPTNAITAAEKRAVFTGILPCLKAYTRADSRRFVGDVKPDARWNADPDRGRSLGRRI